MSEWVGISGAWRPKIGEWIGIGGEWKRVVREWIGISGEWKLAYAALSLSVAPSSALGNNSGPTASGSVTSNVVTATPSYGSGNYTYAWTHVSTTSGNTPTPSGPNSASTSFSATVTDNVDSVSTWLLTLTDTTYGLTETATVGVTLIWTDTR